MPHPFPRMLTRIVPAAVLSLLPGIAFADPPRVVTDVHVVHSLVSQVMGDLGTADLLLEQGGDAHSFQLRPSQARALTDAGLVFWIGENLTPWLARPLASGTTRGRVITLIDAPGLVLRDYGDPEDHPEGHHDAAQDADHDHGNDDGDGNGDGDGHEVETDDHAHDDDTHDDHDHSATSGNGDQADDAAEAAHAHQHDGLDPHLWLDPGNAAVWLDLIATELSDADAENADTYAANAEAAKQALAELDREIAAMLAGSADTAIVPYHDAYGYFADHYGLTLAGTLAEGDAATPGARHLREVQALLASTERVCVFPEAQHDPAYLNAVLEGTSLVPGGALDPSGSTLEPGPDLYPTVLRSLAATIAACTPG